MFRQDPNDHVYKTTLLWKTRAKSNNHKKINHKLHIAPLPIFWGGGCKMTEKWLKICCGILHLHHRSATPEVPCARNTALSQTTALGIACLGAFPIKERRTEKRGRFLRKCRVLTIEFSGNMLVPRKSRVETGFATNVSPKKTQNLS